MEHLHTILGQHHGEDMFYVIAVLILSVAGAVFDKIKKKMAESESERRKISPPLPRPPIGEAPPRMERPITRKSGPERMPPPIPTKRTVPPAPPVARPSERPPMSRLPGRQIKVDVRRIEQPPAKATISTPAELIAQAMRIQKPAEIVSPQAVKQVQNVRTVTARVPLVSEHPATAFRDMSAADWRRAIALSEVLGPPLAIRQHETF